MKRWTDLPKEGWLPTPREWVGHPILVGALESISVRKQQVMYLRNALGLSQEECADVLKINQKAVSKHERTALNTLRRLSLKSVS